MGSCHKYEVPQHSIIGSTLFLLYTNGLPDVCICNIAIYAGDTTLYSKWEQNIWFVVTTKADFWPTKHYGRIWLFDFNAWNWACFVWPVKYDWCYYVKTAGSVLQRKSPFKIPELPFSSKPSLGSHIISVTKTVYKKIGALICSIKFLSPKVALYLFKSAI